MANPTARLRRSRQAIALPAPERQGAAPGVLLSAAGVPALATAGTGDVLTGAIAGILAQCRDPWVASRAGVLVHALAGDAAARGGERGVLASDLVRELHHCVNL